MKSQQVAKQLIERYAFEMAPTFDVSPNWEIIWKIERRFNLIGYGETVERNFLRERARINLERCRELYQKTPDSDSFAWLQNAEHDVVRLG